MQDRFLLKSKRIPLWFELGVFNLVVLIAILPTTWIQYLSHVCWNVFCCGSDMELFFQANLERIEILALGLPVLVAAEIACLRLSLLEAPPQSLGPWIEYGFMSVLRSLPFMLLLFAVMALPEAQLVYALIAGLGLVAMFGVSSDRAALNPVKMLSYRANRPRSRLFKYILLYLSFGLAIPLLFFSRAYACQDRARVSYVKANMHTFQRMVETYALDWDGAYAPGTRQLRVAAQITRPSYWQDFTNPFNDLSGEGGSYAQMPVKTQDFQSIQAAEIYRLETYKDILGIRIYLKEALWHDVPKDELLKREYPAAGLVLYDYISPTLYYIYGLNSHGHLIVDKGKPFVLTNS